MLTISPRNRPIMRTFTTNASQVLLFFCKSFITGLAASLAASNALLLLYQNERRDQDHDHYRQSTRLGSDVVGAGLDWALNCSLFGMAVCALVNSSGLWRHLGSSRNGQDDYYDDDYDDGAPVSWERCLWLALLPGLAFSAFSMLIGDGPIALLLLPPPPPLSPPPPSPPLTTTTTRSREGIRRRHVATKEEGEDDEKRVVPPFSTKTPPRRTPPHLVVLRVACSALTVAAVLLLLVDAATGGGSGGMGGAGHDRAECDRGVRSGDDRDDYGHDGDNDVDLDEYDDEYDDEYADYEEEEDEDDGEGQNNNWAHYEYFRYGGGGGASRPVLGVRLLLLYGAFLVVASRELANALGSSLEAYGVLERANAALTQHCG